MSSHRANCAIALLMIGDDGFRVLRENEVRRPFSISFLLVASNETNLQLDCNTHISPLAFRVWVQLYRERSGLGDALQKIR